MSSRLAKGFGALIKEVSGNKKYKKIMALVAFISIVAALFTGVAISHAATSSAKSTVASPTSISGKAIGSGLAIGLAGIGGGIGVGVAGAAAISAVAENREMFGTAFIFVVLGEGIAIYGLLVAIIILFVLP
ncbi:MAG: hypothetical protein G5Z43_001425 [Caldisphaeraceae archaeon]|nr:hypothetical protein [Caldisphaeraceae archaeon]